MLDFICNDLIIIIKIGIQMSFSKQIKICNTCIESCEACITSCLVGNASKMFGCIQACRDCSDICSMTVRLMSRNSKHANRLAALCAMISDICAKECNKYEDEECIKCAKACKKCSLECSSTSN